MTGAGLRMAWPHFFGAGAVLSTGELVFKLADRQVER